MKYSILSEAIITSDELYDVIIIGAGPAGLAAGIYASRLKLKTLILDSTLPGGRAIYAPLVENFPGFPEGITGAELVEKMTKQTEKFGAETRFSEEVLDTVLKDRVKTVLTRSGKFQGLSVIVATGTQQKKLLLPGESEYVGRGISYCAVCDGPFFKNKIVAIVGSNDNAFEDAIYLSKFSKKVIVVIQSEEIEATQVLVEKTREKANVQILNAKAKEIVGNGFVKALKVIDSSDNEDTLNVDGVFILIGSLPMTNIVKKAGVSLDERGCIQVDRRQTTNIEGVFAAGDCTCGGMQIITAAGEGATAAVQAYKHIKDLKMIRPRNRDPV